MNFKNLAVLVFTFSVLFDFLIGITTGKVNLITISSNFAFLNPSYEISQAFTLLGGNWYFNLLGYIISFIYLESFIAYILWIPLFIIDFFSGIILTIAQIILMWNYSIGLLPYPINYLLSTLFYGLFFITLIFGIEILSSKISGDDD